jgi:hypothetical protein
MIGSLLRTIALTASLIAAATLALLATAAFAAGNIPTRYKGRFPADGVKTNITGTFTGKRLTLKSTRRERASRTKASESSPGQTWICPLGRLLAP